MGLGEADTRAKLIDPALHSRGWTEDLIRREETAGAIEVVDGRPRRRARGRTDYVLRVRINASSQPVAGSLPPLPDQQRVVADLKTQLERVALLEAQPHKHVRTLDALPGALLRQAFSGVLQPRRACYYRVWL